MERKSKKKKKWGTICNATCQYGKKFRKWQQFKRYGVVILLHGFFASTYIFLKAFPIYLLLITIVCMLQKLFGHADCFIIISSTPT